MRPKICPAVVAVLMIGSATAVRAKLPPGIVIADKTFAAPIIIDDKDPAVVNIAANLLAEDVNRVAGQKPAIKNAVTDDVDQAIIVGTIDSTLIRGVTRAHKIDNTELLVLPETFIRRVVDNPMPHVKRALVIIGSDRRGTAYGVMGISEQIGVSPWNWWADVPVAHADELKIFEYLDGDLRFFNPAVKYRGIFLNDEDFGLRPWASKTFDPKFGNLGPKTYEKLFELMLRLRLNYLWPAMHPGSAEFGSVPGNAELADKWAIVMGASHCEPMLRNNVYWPKSQGPWRYDVNRDNILDYWKESTVRRGRYEAVWTLGIRGIHDSGMQGPKEMSARQKMLDGIIEDQRELISLNVVNQYRPPAQVFIPYKEVLPIYEAGLVIPDDVTIMWPDDNFGYMRRLPTETERKRIGGSGVYYHLSYWGSPKSYLWLETIPPALMYEELMKAAHNDATQMWVVNVGDLKPAEVALDCYSRIAWGNRTDGPPFRLDSFVLRFMQENFGEALAPKLAALQNDYYRTNFRRKPEHVDFDWVNSLSNNELAETRQRYEALLADESTVAATVPADHFDAYFEMIGYPAKMSAAAGLCYLDAAAGNVAGAKKWKAFVDEQTRQYNDDIAGGKWHRMMSQYPEGVAWPAAVGGKAKPAKATTRPINSDKNVFAAAAFMRSESGAAVQWTPIEGLGYSGKAVTVLDSSVEKNFQPGHADGPRMTYEIQVNKAGEVSVIFDLLPTMRVDVKGALRFAAAMDDGSPVMIDVPGGTDSDEYSKVRRVAVLSNRVAATFDAGRLSAGRHKLIVFAADPGVVIDQIELPANVDLIGPTNRP